MATSLRADNRSITRDGKYSYLVDNYSSGAASFTVTNTEGFFHNSYLLTGNIGSENTEILQLQKVDPITNILTFKNFTDTAVGAGILTVTLGAAGSGYQVGEILTVKLPGGAWGTGKVKVETILPGGAIDTISVAQSGYGYTVVGGIATTGGGNNAATINITALTTATTATSILFNISKTFIAGQPVEVFNGTTGASRGTGTVSANSNPSSTTMALTAPGITGTVAGDLVVVGDVTKFAHSESTKLTVIQYNAVRFFRTDTPVVPNVVPYTSLEQNQDKSITQTTKTINGAARTTTYTQPDDPSFVTTVDFTPPIVFTGATALTSPTAIQVNDFYSTFIDTINLTGYGWFAFYNETTLTYSPISNAIPYAGFPQNTVRKVFETFDSSMNTKELKLISQSDRFNWMNEGLSYMTNELNLGNWEYFASEELTLNLIGGVAKYLLPQDFSDLLFVNDSKNQKVEAYSATFERANYTSPMKYAIRGRFIIFYPAPNDDATVTLAYLKSSPLLNKLDDVLDLPNNAYYAIKDYMRFRAYQKLKDANEANNSFAFFKSQIDNMKIHAIKRDDGLDAWSIAYDANV